ncbi:MULTISPECIES: transporter substrate-binding domain-containing protein [unclassified Azospirillum]|uniref:transporter substrate-binding domain-containing protein n=1 Tax=unclassified Azospirillum TaxID=2630922 RepID=UPI000B72CDC4|nr:MULTISPECIES: transporter substrate-binding domain-containing protein [unclassified Azospirillum]SNS32000.1 amino acid ABC transporter substrate-binding protein, PAAT family [Azospirillum sp. RU38E]SNS50406.1 amino acid ABC transporter substrate-binding protein, PAAT family [Azospirillum sp. RU37A]
MKSWIAALGLACVTLLGGCGKEEAAKQAAPAAADSVPNPLRVATEGAYPPYNMVDASGNLVGFEIDMMKDICRRMKVECQFVATAWDGMIPALQAGRFDVVVAGMSITEERLQAVDFSDGYTTTPAYLVSANSNPLQKEDYGVPKVDLSNMSPESQAALDKLRGLLKGKVMGVQTATIHANFAEKYLGDVVDLRRYDTQEQLALDMQSGRIEVGLADAVTWNAFLQRPEGKDYSFFGPGFDGGLFGRGQGVALVKGRTALKTALNSAIKEMKADGTMKTMSVQWFGFDTSMP